MAIRGSLLLLCLMFVGLVAADEQLPPPKEGKLLKEVWEAAFLEGSQAGYAFASFREMAMGENPNILASTEMELNLVRFGQNLQLKFGMSDVETPAGKMLGFVVHETKSKGQVQVRKGKIDGKQVTITTEMPGQEPKEVKFPWNDKSLGLYAQERLFAEKKPEPNTKFDFIKFEPMLDTWLTIHVQVQDFEEVALLDGKKQK